MAVHPNPHNEAWKVVTNTGVTIEHCNNGQQALSTARIINRCLQVLPGPVIPIQAVRA